MRELHAAVREEGRVPHDLIARLELWHDVRSDQLMLQLQLLLYHFQLGYPAGGGDLEWDSDVMVPLYWRKCVPSEVTPQEKAECNATLPHRVCWEYDFHSFLPEELYEKFGVASYSSQFSTDRVFTRDSFESVVEGVYTARVRRFYDELDGTNGLPNILAIEAYAASEDTAWQQLIWYILNLEKVLDSYRGLWITRYAVTRLGRRIPIDKLISEQRDTASLARTAGLSPTSHSAYKTLLPPKMDWFTQKKWWKQANYQEVDQADRGNGGVDFTEMSHRMSQMGMRMVAVLQSVEGKVDSTGRAIVNVVASIGNKMDYPALWTLEHHTGHRGITSTFVLRIRSQLSGKCFHDPIQITVGNEFFGKYGVRIQTGLSLFASVIPDMLGKNAIDTIISACSTELDRTVHVHGLVKGLDLPNGGYHDMERNRSLSPDETVALLRDLLTVYDPTFDIKKMSKISKLECGIVHESGDCLWAHRDEIQERSATMRFRHDYTKSSFESEKTGELWPSDAKEMKNGSSPLEKDQRVKSATFRLLDAQKLRKVPVLGKQRPYCKWKLINSDNQEISSGRTSNSSSSPNWSDQSYSIDFGTLKGSKLDVVVKTPRLFGRMSTTIATGSYVFQDDLEPDQSRELCAPLTRGNSPAGELRFTMHTSNS